MKRFQFSRLVLFLYDIARLIVIVGIMTQLGKLSLANSAFPYLVYASAQALFPIMTWFFYIDAQNYLVYVPLNIAGKSVYILLSGIWAVHAVSQISSAMSVDLFVCLGLTLIILFTDIMSILGMFFIKKGLNDFAQNEIEKQDTLRNDSETDHIIGGM